LYAISGWGPFLIKKNLQEELMPFSKEHINTALLLKLWRQLVYSIMLVKIFSAIWKKPTIVYLEYYLLRMNINMKYGNTVITLFYLNVIPIFLRLHF